MATIDSVIIFSALFSVLLGLVLGFGKGLKILSRGWTGRIVSVIICYVIFGTVLSWGFVQNFLGKIVDSMLSKDVWILKLLVKIRIDLVIFAVLLFIVVQILRKIITSLVGNFGEIDKPAVKIINKILGIILFAFFVFVLMLFVFQVVRWVSGDSGSFYDMLCSSKFKIYKLYTNNPLNGFIENIKRVKEKL